jgi:predicted NUDIX family NTP pyrophosphohydrolase
LEVLVAHPGGPYFARRDEGWWSIVKGIVEPDESDLMAARREFTEETGWAVPEVAWVDLGETRLKSRKIVTAWGLEADFDPSSLVPGTFQMGSRHYPEIDRVEWMPLEAARVKLNPALGVFLDRLEQQIAFRRT